MTIGTGGVKLEDRVLDLGLNVLDTEATHIYVNSQQPTTYAEATTTYVRGYKNFGAGAGFGSPGAWTSGRKVSSVAITDGTITTTGTVACWSAVDAANSRLHAAGDLTGGGAVTAGQTFSLTSFDVQMMRAPSLDSATTAWISAIGAPAPSSAQQTRVDNLIKNLKAHGLWTVLDRLWLFAGENQTNQATTDIKGLALGTNHGMTLANNGYLGNGTSNYFDTGFAPASGGPYNYVRNAATYGFYDMTSNTTPRVQQPFGQFDGTSGGSTMNMMGGTGAYGINDSTNGSYTFVDSVGIWVIWRTGATTAGIDRYYTGGPFSFTESLASIPVINYSFFVGAFNNTGTAQDFSTDRIGAVFVGALTSAQGATLATDLNAYMTACGVNVY